ncbi:MAG: hypothetical protein LW650_01250 [Planctomycetaceae bacterium]|jgi:hypothetical protein|nr:hypothetical protein [Planctomycetaceae bacterium]
MAVQRIKPIERHVEKIVLGASAAGLLGVIAWQVAGTRNSITVDKKALDVAQVYPALQGMAEKLRSEMTRTQFADLPSAPVLALQEEFKARITKGVSPTSQLAWSPAAPKLPGGVSTGTVVTVARINVPAVPAPSPAVAFAFMSTVADQEVRNAIAQEPDAAGLFSGGNPHDMPAVSVEVEFSGKDLRAALERDPDGPNGPVPAIPRAWWDATAALGVELVRERRLPDGTWGEQTAVPHLPGRLSLAKDLAAADLTAEQLTELSKLAATREEELLRPSYYANAVVMNNMIGSPWEPPRDAVESAKAGEGSAAERKRREYTRELRKLQNMEAARQTQGAPDPGAGGGGRGVGGPGGRGVGPGRDTPPPQQAQRSEQEIRLERQRALVARLKQELEALGEKVAADPNAGRQNVADRGVAALLVQEKFNVYAHDISVKRGETYRYQVRLKFTNPLYGRAGNLEEKDAAFAAKPFMASPPSAWSAPVEVPQQTYAFIVGGRPRDITGSSSSTGLGGGATASAELFAFTWGHWRSARVPLEPGDALEATVEVPDLAKVIEATGEQMPTPPPGGPVPGGPGRTITPGAPVPPPGGPTGNQPQPGAKIEIPRKQLVISKDSFLLDVTAAPESEPRRTLIQAVLRDLGGRIAIRQPDRDQADALYRRLVASARSGEDQFNMTPGQPGGGGMLPPPPSERPETEPAQPPPPTPGGGGGGGGGGG